MRALLGLFMKGKYPVLESLGAIIPQNHLLVGVRRRGAQRRIALHLDFRE